MLMHFKFLTKCAYFDGVNICRFLSFKTIAIELPVEKQFNIMLKKCF